jgi:uncharacterized protein DUF4124
VIHRFLFIIALAGAAAEARAETFKWVDERGVVNYSNQPSAAKSSPRTVVEDRISTYESPPLRAVAAYRTPDYEWLQRQRIMMEMAAANNAVADYAYPFVPVVVVRRAHRLLRTSRPSR